METPDIQETARKRFDLCQEAFAKRNKIALEDLEFRKGDHWPTDVKNARALEKRPCLTINKMPQFIRQITNDQKQNRAAIKVSPVDDYADIDTAKVLQGLIRNIENLSDAESAYDKAFEGAAIGGFGFFRLTTEYENAMSFNLEPRIEMIDNPLNCALDPDSIEYDGSDSEYGFVWDKMTKEDFINEFGESKLAKHEDWSAVVDQNQKWVNEDDVLVCEYFYKDYESVDLIQLEDGKTYNKKDLPEQLDNGFYEIEGSLFGVLNERKSKICKIKWLKLNGIEILEETEWPGQYIPIIPVYGDVLNVDGEKIFEGVIRHAKDPQRILNFWASQEAEAITLAPKAPFIGAEGQFEGHEAEWKTANIKNQPYLEYQPVSLNGQPVAPPQRSSVEPAVMAITQARQLANEDIKATTGIYDASLGARSGETSGIAIQRRNVQSQTSNFHLIDNLNKSIKHCGRILVEIIPKVYDVPRVIRTLGEQDEQEIVKINQIFEKDGEMKEYNFTYGKYDVAISTGPNYETKRQEARDSMISMSQSNPKFAEIAGDLMVKNMDWPGADDIAERLKRTIPPELLDEKEKQVPPQVQAQMQQMNQMIEGLTNQLNEAQQINQTKAQELESKERIEIMKIQSDLKIEQMKIDGKNSNTVLSSQLDQMNKRLDQLGINEPIESVDISVERQAPETGFNF